MTAGVGVVAFTAVEGLACGNPMEPAYIHKTHEAPIEATPVEAGSAVEAATPLVTDASPTPVAPGSSKASPPKR